MGAVAGSISSQRDNLRVRREGRGALEGAKRLLRSDRKAPSEFDTVSVRVNFLPTETLDETSSMSMDGEMTEGTESSDGSKALDSSANTSFKSWRDEQSLFAAESEALGDSEKENTPLVRFSLAGRFMTEEETLPGYLSESESDHSELESTSAAESLSRTAMDSVEMRPAEYRRQRRRHTHDGVVTETWSSVNSVENGEYATHEWNSIPLGNAASHHNEYQDRVIDSVHAGDLSSGESWQRQRVTAPEPTNSYFWDHNEQSGSRLAWKCATLGPYENDKLRIVSEQKFAEHACLPDSTIMLFDWDDTLLSSTWLSSMGHRVDDSQPLPPELLSELEDLEDLVIGTLRDAQRFGRVCVVTNAEAGWVQLSAARFMPRVLKHLDASEIRIISARSIYEIDFPNSPSDWKTQAFRSELEKHPKFPDSLNLLVLGDSVSERDAAHAVRKYWLHDGLVKTVKFIERPTLEQLRRQLGLIHKALPHICAFEGSFDVNLVVD
jgi:hypothetical protein